MSTTRSFAGWRKSDEPTQPTDVAPRTPHSQVIEDPSQIVGAKDSWKNAPDFARSDIEIAKSRAALNLEEANAVPDPKISVSDRPSTFCSLSRKPLAS